MCPPARPPCSRLGGDDEHHPFWHVSSLSIQRVDINTQGAAHGWFGDGVRIRCWEDLVLSKGTAAYLAGRALDVVAPPIGVAYWARYEPAGGMVAPANKVVWPQGCGALDILSDPSFVNVIRKRGALFYRTVALTVGAAKLDSALATFYAAHVTHAATMAEMLDTIHTVTGYDPARCADMWLRSTTATLFGPCP